ncbi:3-isopropylmalate dehydrogenase [Roseivirga pacifica]|uniref:3-isopropylmalate dehydrogenase n=1 Tax=Roseivirga pacifica TaxID=1267423 RepID=UPI0020941224|nr:3-isopropylmalate dehydrogenase [Roseivirga pacifica]MCO6361000.1 3-isopropylmalate dehydrogenase [Roseivirga pacifica]MCO6368889.1 3-isopropylmalate dehydrogenase [Roseivirga pacifica]MCO6373112.1 3-isopropylmalate dehydrogenase [Roseivirga pacifica]MCO6377631.1 3-isopropylmalate dehydrogenase [Roseivirga pacifica]
MGVKKNIGVLPGDGIGPEVTREAVKVLNAIAEKHGHTFEYNYGDVGAIAIDKTGNPLPDETLAVCEASDAFLFGAIGHPKYDNDPSAKVRPEQGLLKLRKSLGLFANIRPVTAYDSLLHMSPLKTERVRGADFVVYRELTGGIYFGEKGRTEDGAYDNCTYSNYEIDRIAHLAFQAAQNRNKKLMLVDKANVLETSRLWRERVTAIAKEYPDVALEAMFVDNAAMQMIQNPKQFDVILTENMFGDIISDEASVIGGSLGLLPSASVGEKSAMFEPIHGSYPQGAGKNIANPLATILSAAMMLDHLGLIDEAIEVRQAVNASLRNGMVTEDLTKENPVGTDRVGDFIANHILEGEDSGSSMNIKMGLSTII